METLFGRNYIVDKATGRAKFTTNKPWGYLNEAIGEPGNNNLLVSQVLKDLDPDRADGVKFMLRLVEMQKEKDSKSVFANQPIELRPYISFPLVTAS